MKELALVHAIKVDRAFLSVIREGERGAQWVEKDGWIVLTTADAAYRIPREGVKYIREWGVERSKKVG